MFIGLAIQEALGIAFGLAVIVWSFWLVYRWAIKPDRDRRTQDALHATEEMHRNHWEHLRIRRICREFEESEEANKKAETTSSAPLKKKGVSKA